MAKKKSKKPASKKKNTKAKKGKSSKKEESSKKSQVPDGFWQQVTAFFLILVAILLTFGSFDTGGPLAVAMFGWTKWLLGVVAYVLPVALVVVAVLKIRSEKHRLPRSLFWGFVILFVSASGFAHLFIDEASSMQAVKDGVGGGFVGHSTDTALLFVLNKITSGIVLFFFAVVALHFVFGLPLTHFFRLFGLAKKEKEGEPQQGVIKEGKPTKFKLNEGVPVQRSTIASSRATEKLGDKQPKEALITVGDPNWNFPTLDLLIDKQDKADVGDINERADIIKNTLAEFKISVEMQGANVGPRVTQYTLKPPSGVQLSKITALENNLALNLAASQIRIEAPIPGKSAVGIEVPNIKPASVRIYDVLSGPEWKRQSANLMFALGKDISGKNIVADLDSMPHLLVAGTTGSGKSVMINTILTSLLYRNSPSDLKLILVDPKLVELNAYNDIPHLLTPVINDPAQTLSALKWAIKEMERRYLVLKEFGRKNIGEYNRLKKEEGMPYIVIVVDELSDLMAAAARDLENSIVRLAQKSRAVGIHLILATQRPDANVITGLIKANIPSRIAFRTNDQINSRVIIDRMGAEKLLGQGDMLYKNSTMSEPIRVQAALAETEEVERVAEFIKEERGPQYDDEVVSQEVRLSGGGGSITSGGGDNRDSLYEEAAQVFIDAGKASTALLQRRLRIGYSRAASIVDALEEQGVISPADGSRPRKVLISNIQELTGESMPDDDDYGEEIEVKHR